MTRKMPVDSPENDLLKRGRKKRVFLYRQLADILREKILNGEYSAGEKIPSTDELSEVYNLNKATVRSALAMLVKEGLIFSLPARGTFVCEHEKITELSGNNGTLTIGIISPVIFPGHTGPYHIQLIEAIRQEISGLNANIVLVPVNEAAATNVSRAVAGARLNGLIAIGPMDEAIARCIEKIPLPKVLVDQTFDDISMDCISFDNHDGGRKAVEYLVTLGHKNIAVIAGDPKHPATTERLKGAKDAHKTAMLKDEMLVLYADFMIEGGYEKACSLLQLKKPPTAIFCLNDEMAAGAIQAVHETTNLNVPEDISIIGFDDSSLAGMLTPRLTTVKAPTGAMGKAAAQSLKNQLEDSGHTPGRLSFVTSIVERKSTAPVQ